MELQVLDRGFVRLVDSIGGDSAVVQAARVSHGTGLKGEEKDRRLIHYLMRHQHMSPFEHAVFKFHIKAPIFVARQWFRHRWASYNEISGRYTEYPEEFYIPNHIRVQSPKDKQTSEIEDLNDRDRLIGIIKENCEKVFKSYRELLSKGVAREMARIILPLNLYTQWYWTANARSLMNFILLRAEEHAQWEIRQYALQIARIFKEKMPWSWEAFLEYIWQGDRGVFD